MTDIVRLCNTLAMAVTEYNELNEINLLDNKIILADGLDKYGVVVKKGIEDLAALLGQRLNFRIVMYDNLTDYCIEKSFKYNGANFYQTVFVKEKDFIDDNGDIIIYDNTKEKVHE